MAGRALQEMIDEEAKIDMTPMIDVVFLLLIFFMLMKFKSYEKKLDSHLPKDEGMEISNPEIQTNLTIRIQPYGGDPTKIMIIGQSQAPVFAPIQWMEATREEEGRQVVHAHPEMFALLQQRVVDELRKGHIDKKIVLAPFPQIPFDYVALTLDAVHKAHEHFVNERMDGAMNKLNELHRQAEQARHARQWDRAAQIEDERKKMIEDLRERGIWKDVTFEAPPMDIS